MCGTQGFFDTFDTMCGGNIALSLKCNSQLLDRGNQIQLSLISNYTAHTYTYLEYCSHTKNDAKEWLKGGKAHILVSIRGAFFTKSSKKWGNHDHHHLKNQVFFIYTTMVIEIYNYYSRSNYLFVSYSV
jgi:hypothetical protein